MIKRTFFVMLIILLLALAGCGDKGQTALAVNVPVYLEGERVATALERGGYTYLPMRTMFELVGAEVEWDEPSQTITANLLGGNVLTMRIGEEEASLRQAGNEYAYGLGMMDTPPFISKGTAYVPLRFITDGILDYDLDWHDNAVWLTIPKLSCVTNPGEEFVLNLLDGSLTKEGELLGRVDLPSIGNSTNWHLPFSLRVSQTSAGNYLLTAEGMGSGALSFAYKLAAYVPATGGEIKTYCVHSMLGELPSPCMEGDNIWFPDDEIGALCVNDKTGEVTEYRLSEIAPNVRDAAGRFVWWSDGRFILLGSGFDFDLYDSQKQNWVDLSAELVTPELKAHANEFLRSADRYFQEDSVQDYYWNYLGHSMPIMDPVPLLRFDTVSGDELRLTLCCGYWQKDEAGVTSMNTKEYPLTYKLPE